MYNRVYARHEDITDIVDASWIVPTRELKPEVSVWLKLNFGDEAKPSFVMFPQLWRKTVYSNCVLFEFANKEDAELFKETFNGLDDIPRP